MPTFPIPETITVHLGTPQSNAQNFTLPFPDYIKNVASGEIYPTWPENAIRANVYAQISFALNRIFTEHYPSQGYDFDITNSTYYDQYFSPGREVFNNIGKIVDEIFNSYVERQGTVGPYFTQYCDGRRVSCNGLSQWGTVSLANQGLTPYEILQYYYGDDINLVQNAAIRQNVPSYRGYPVRLGEENMMVKQIQVRLNRISNNYPSIPKINPVDGIFGTQTEDAVLEFQRIFNLTQDGIIGQATWYKIIFVYNAVKRLSELDSEGISVEEYSQQFPGALRFGDSGNSVRVMQYYLSAVANYYPTIPTITLNGNFDKATRDSVIAFQRQFGLTPDGIVGENTWDELYRVYLGLVDSDTFNKGGTRLFPGEDLKIGSRGEDVRLIQEYLNYIANTYTEITKPAITGYYGQQTALAVRQFQQLFDLNPSGAVGPLTWDKITSVYSDLSVGNTRQSGQFPGYVLSNSD